MNRTSCPEGTATDGVFTISTTPCDTSYTAFVITVTLTVLGKWILVYHHSIAWLRRRRQLIARTHAGTVERRRVLERHPFVPILSLISAIMYQIFAPLGCLNLVGAFNGSALPFYGAGFCVFGMSASLFLLKFVRLGRKIIETHHPRHLSDKSTTSSPASGSASHHSATARVESAAEDILSRFDSLGFVLFYIQCIYLVVQTIALCIVYPINNEDMTPITVGFVAGGLFMAQYGLSFIWQVQRLIQCVESTWYVVSEDQARKKATLRLQLRTQQYVIVAFANLAAVVLLLIGIGVIPLRWYALVTLMGIDAGAQLALAMAGARRARASKARLAHVANGNTEAMSGATIIKAGQGDVVVVVHGTTPTSTAAAAQGV